MICHLSSGFTNVSLLITLQDKINKICTEGEQKLRGRHLLNVIEEINGGA